MEFKEILAISGFGGLFKYISQARNGIIVEGFEDKKRMNAFAHYKVSSLNDIAIFADSGEIPLRKIFKMIQEMEKGGLAIDSKSDDAKLKEYFAKVLPDYDRQKVYLSDIKKLISWYNILHKNGYTNFEEEEKKEEDKNTEDQKEEREHIDSDKKEVLPKTKTKQKSIETKKAKDTQRKQVTQTTKIRKKT
jgi:hypothetical protein